MTGDYVFTEFIRALVITLLIIAMLSLRSANRRLPERLWVKPDTLAIEEGYIIVSPDTVYLIRNQ